MLAEVENLVRSQQLVVDYVISPVRTVSTAVSIALAQTADGQIQEPFHPMRSQTVDEGMGIIFERYQSLKSVLLRETGNPIRLMVKDIMKYCNEPRWQAINAISHNFVATIREPSACFWSLLTRRANDFIEFGSDQLSREEVGKRLVEIPVEKWTDQSWERLPRMVSMAVEAGKKVSIISGGALKADPTAVLRAVCLRHGWEFQPQMVNGWVTGLGSKFFNPLPKYAPTTYRVSEDQGARVRTAYWAQAVESRGIDHLHSGSDRWVVLGDFLPQMRTYLMDQMYPSYVSLVKKLDFIDTGELKSLVEVNPVEVLVLLGIRATRQGLSEHEQAQLKLARWEVDAWEPELLALLEDLMR